MPSIGRLNRKLSQHRQCPCPRSVLERLAVLLSLCLAHVLHFSNQHTATYQVVSCLVGAVMSEFLFYFSGHPRNRNGLKRERLRYFFLMVRKEEFQQRVYRKLHPVFATMFM